MVPDGPSAVRRRASTRPSCIAYFAIYEDLWWVLDEAQQRRLLTLPPSAFDDNRATWGLVRAQVYQHRGQPERARVYADSALPQSEQRFWRRRTTDRRTPCSASRWRMRGGRRRRSVRENVGSHCSR